MTTPPRDHQEALAALERLYRKAVVTQEEGQAAARLITGNPDLVFPAPAAPAEDKPAAGPAEGGPRPSEAAAGEESSPG